MIIGIPKERQREEKRVAISPKVAEGLIKLGYEVVVERKAGAATNFSDEDYEAAGAKIVSSQAIWESNAIYKVNPITEKELELLEEGTVVVSFFYPVQNADLLNKINQKNITQLAMDMVPRISRAQSMDALSSMANISGYRAVIEAAESFGRFFAGQITAAGKIPPAKVLVIGAGVAGLSAIGTAKSLGAVVRAFDTRLEVAEQIESMGGEFLKIDFEYEDSGSGSGGYAKVMSDEFITAEKKLFAEQAKDVDIIITTAAIPGKPSPKIITKEMVDSMKSGSVIVDLAALGGGNCEYTEPGKVIKTPSGVTIIGYTDLPNRLAGQSSQLYANNLLNLTKLLTPEKEGQMYLNYEDVIIRNMTVCDEQNIMFPPPPIEVSAVPQKTVPDKIAERSSDEEVSSKNILFNLKNILYLVGFIFFFLIGAYAPAEFLNHFVVFTLSCVVGYYVVWNVTHSLHTPLMSVTNAISGIVILGAIMQVGLENIWIKLLSFLAILLVSVNIFGGFYVTRRMLNMFRKEDNK